MQDFYEDIFEELAKFGEVQNLNVCDNLADHMVGSVYAKVRRPYSGCSLGCKAWRWLTAMIYPHTGYRKVCCVEFGAARVHAVAAQP